MKNNDSPPNIERLLLTRELWREIKNNCPSDGLEAGGKAMGRIYTDGSAVACLHIPGGPSARRDPAAFRPDIPYQQACYEALVSRYPGTRLVLDYHLHPSSLPGLSGTDLRAAAEMLNPGGWGLESIVLMVLTHGSNGLKANAFYAHRASGSSGRSTFSGSEPPPELYPVEVGYLDSADPRVAQLLSASSQPPEVILPGEILEGIEDALQARPEQAVPLYGYQRLDEDLVQVIGTSPVLDGYAIGQAFVEGEELPPQRERELRLLFEPGRAPRALFRLGAIDLPCKLEHPRLLREIRLRNQGLVCESELQKRHVAFIGLGSVGAPIVLALARAGVGRFTLIDPDRFSASNVARHVGDARDLGRRKDTLLRERLLACHPTARVESIDQDVGQAMGAAALEDALSDADLLVVSTDDPGANLAANRLALALRTRALFVGVYEGGTAGEIFALRPDQGTCYACVSAFRAELPPVPRKYRAHDYVNAREGAELPPLNALGIDIAHTVSVASSAALGLLGEEERLKGILEPERPLLFVANGKAGWIFDQPFELIPAELQEKGCAVCSDEKAEAVLAETFGAEVDDERAQLELSCPGRSDAEDDKKSNPDTSRDVASDGHLTREMTEFAPGALCFSSEDDGVDFDPAWLDPEAHDEAFEALFGAEDEEDEEDWDEIECEEAEDASFVAGSLEKTEAGLTGEEPGEPGYEDVPDAAVLSTNDEAEALSHESAFPPVAERDSETQELEPASIAGTNSMIEAEKRPPASTLRRLIRLFGGSPEKHELPAELAGKSVLIIGGEDEDEDEDECTRAFPESESGELGPIDEAVVSEGAHLRKGDVARRILFGG